jgi:hypothetical protein
MVISVLALHHKQYDWQTKGKQESGQKESLRNSQPIELRLSVGQLTVDRSTNVPDRDIGTLAANGTDTIILGKYIKRRKI